jgi:hypothetical protein
MCAARLKSTEEMRAGLLRLNAPRIPAALAVQLRVLASHERTRHLARANFAARVQNFKERVHLNFDNLMRPIALPLAGGILSALLLFGALVPKLVFRHDVSNEPPLSFTDPDGQVVNWTGDLPRLEPVGAATSSDENVLELTIDNEGRVADYIVRQGHLTPEMLSIIQFSRLTPAMFFGKPTWGKKLIVLPGQRRNVRG